MGWVAIAIIGAIFIAPFLLAAWRWGKASWDARPEPYDWSADDEGFGPWDGPSLA